MQGAWGWLNDIAAGVVVTTGLVAVGGVFVSNAVKGVVKEDLKDLFKEIREHFQKVDESIVDLDKRVLKIEVRNNLDRSVREDTD